MRLKHRLICLLLFFTLSAGGWGSVLAAALCPHAGSPAKVLAAMPEDHACCRAKLAGKKKKEEPHCHTAAPSGEKAGDMPRAGTASGTHGFPYEQAFGDINACTHCLTRSAPVNAPLNLLCKNQSRRVVDALAPYKALTNISFQASFSLPVLTRQGAPPGSAATRRHILHSAFLI